MWVIVNETAYNLNLAKTIYLDEMFLEEGYGVVADFGFKEVVLSVHKTQEEALKELRHKVARLNKSKFEE